MPAPRPRAPSCSAVFAHAADSVLIYSAEGDLLRANPRARGKLEELAGGVPATIQELRPHVRAGRKGEAPLGDAAIGSFLRGEIPQLHVRIGRGASRHIHLRAGPIRDRRGRVSALIVVARDVTDLRASCMRDAGVNAALATARRASHELGSPLGVILLQAQMLLGHEEPVAQAARSILAAVESAAVSLRRLQRITRFVEADVGMGLAMLDLDAAIADEPK